MTTEFWTTDNSIIRQLHCPTYQVTRSLKTQEKLLFSSEAPYIHVVAKFYTCHGSVSKLHQQIREFLRLHVLGLLDLTATLAQLARAV